MNEPGTLLVKLHRTVAPAPPHIFHEDCARVWLRSRANCPTCREEVRIQNVVYSRV
jgi:hypothetical protein